MKILAFVLLAALALGSPLGIDQGIAAEVEAGSRKATLVVEFTEYEWWLIRYSDNLILCQVPVDHEGLPTGNEIAHTCGAEIFTLWRSTPPCDAAASSACPGLYLFLVSSQPATKEIVVDLPPVTAWIELGGCTPTFPENRCEQIPSLVITGEEPLPNEHITAVHATYLGRSFNCEGAVCEIPLEATPLEGMTVEFWADSSFGDSTPHFTAQVRVIETGFSPSPTDNGWYVDVLSSQWRGRPVASCAQTWQTFPPVGGPPPWLLTPEVPELLATEEPYFFLAGRLISQGVVDAVGCPNGGLLPNGWADACGLETAWPEVQAWQNQFDARIIDVARQTSVPAQLMKNLFAQESQFWPGMFSTEHMGLGHITENGAEALLLWNKSFYQQFCPLILEASTCEKGYTHLAPEEQALLRGALAVQAKTDCTDCPAGIDLSNANFSVDLFAQTLLANCEQVGQEVFNATQKVAGTVATYADLWRFTLANYHAGPGCLSYALYTTWSRGQPLTWDNVAAQFTEPCKGVVYYVDQVTSNP